MPRLCRLPAPFRRPACCLIACLAVALPAVADTREWPQWLGPDSNGAAQVRDVFGEREPLLEERWRRPLGSGYSAISIADGRGFTMATVEENDVVVAFDAATGETAWQHTLDSKYAGHDGSHDGPLSTPTIADGRVFALSPRGKLFAYRAADGEPLWQRDLVSDFTAKQPYYGFSTAPLVIGDTLYVLVGGETSHNLVAFAPESGKVRWSTSHAVGGSYASPIEATLAGVHQIVVTAKDAVYGITPDDGALLWRYGPVEDLERTPVVAGEDRLLLPLASEAVMIQLAAHAEGEGLRVEEAWRSPRLKNSYSPTVLHEDALYGFNGRFLTCLDAGDGTLLWRHRLADGALILVDRHLLVLGQRSGLLHVVAASRDGFLEKARQTVLDAEVESYSPPSFAQGRVYLRNLGEMVALDIGAALPTENAG